MQNPPFDLVLRSGRVFDSRLGTFAEGADVGIRDRRIAEIGTGLGPGREEVDCTGRIVAPGLVDAHVHVYEGVLSVGLDAASAAISRGVVACADAGSAGATTFGGFRDHVIAHHDFRILSFLNVAVIGIVDVRFGELVDLEAFQREETLAVIEANRDHIRGLKLRMGTKMTPHDPLGTLERSVALAREAGLPLMVHVGSSAHPLADIVARLGAGDIVTHVYTANEHGLFEDGATISPVILEGRERGVLFDVGHGRTQLDYGVARRALDAGFPPDVISSDVSNGNWRGPAYDLATVMSKFVALGMPLEQVLRATTSAPAEILGIRDEGYGALEPGALAHVTVLEQLEKPDELPDAAGARLEVARLEPTAVVSRGELLPVTPWRGLPSSEPALAGDAV